ncbi:hypothetical protein [Deinococcus sp. PEB2-63]
MVSARKVLLPDGYIHKPELSKLVTAADLKSRPIYNWFYFPHSFSPLLVGKLVDYWNGDERGPVKSLLDPFVGAGTTLLAARSLGLTAVGADLSPLSVFISKAKLNLYNWSELKEEVDIVIRTAKNDKKAYKTSDKRLSKALTPEEYSNLQRLRKAIYSYGDNGLLFLAFLGVLRETSRAHADGGWFRWIDKPNAADDIFKAFRNKALNYIQEASQTVCTNTSQQTVFLSDARSLSEVMGSFDAIVTSPPYPNKHDYTRVFHLELLLGAGLRNDEIAELRHKSLRSHVEAKRPTFVDEYAEPTAVTQLIKEIKAAGADARVERMLQGYVEDMYIALLRMHERLSAHGRAALVVSNVRHSGVMFPVDELLVEIACKAGFDWDQTWVARHRGNSAQQMSLYGRDPARESVVLLRKR